MEDIYKAFSDYSRNGPGSRTEAQVSVLKAWNVALSEWPGETMLSECAPVFEQLYEMATQMED